MELIEIKVSDEKRIEMLNKLKNNICVECVFVIEEYIERINKKNEENEGK